MFQKACQWRRSIPETKCFQTEPKATSTGDGIGYTISTVLHQVFHRQHNIAGHGIECLNRPNIPSNYCRKHLRQMSSEHILWIIKHSVKTRPIGFTVSFYSTRRKWCFYRFTKTHRIQLYEKTSNVVGKSLDSLVKLHRNEINLEAFKKFKRIQVLKQREAAVGAYLLLLLLLL
jgi:hypothetical protein